MIITFVPAPKVHTIYESERNFCVIQKKLKHSSLQQNAKYNSHNQQNVRENLQHLFCKRPSLIIYRNQTEYDKLDEQFPGADSRGEPAYAP